MEKSATTLPAFNAFIAASKEERDVRRTLVLKQSDYLELESNTDELNWFWNNVCGRGSVELRCTQQEWLETIFDKEKRFPYIDLVIFGGEGESIDDQVKNAQVIAYLAGGFSGHFDDTGHVIKAGGDVLVTSLMDIASFFTLSGLDTSREGKLKRCLVPCPNKTMFLNRVKTVLIKPVAPTIQDSKIFWGDEK